jgi:hypothetical protein
MTWSEHWPIAEADAEAEGQLDARAIARLVEAALAARELPIGPAIIHEGDELEGVRLESFGRFVTIGLGVGELRGAITVARPDGGDPGGDPGYVELTSDDVRGPWEPLYLLFAELAAALGATQEPPIAAELDPDELREDVRSTVDACVADAMYGDGLTSGDTSITDAGEAPLDAFELDVELSADAVVARVTGAGARFVVVAHGPAAGLSPDGRAAIERALREDLESCIAQHRWLRHQRRAPPADPARAGKLFLERRAAGRAVSAEELTELDALRRALAEHDVDVIRYFSSGAPFWKASYERGHELDELVTSLDALHADRTWQWQAPGA